MMDFEEFNLALVEDDGPHWLNVYVDRNGTFWIQRSGGMGTSIFMQLESDHPYTGYINELLEESLLSQGDFESLDEVGSKELAQLKPKKSWTSFSKVDKADEDFLSTREEFE